MCNFMGFRVSKHQHLMLNNIEKELGSLAALYVLQSGFAYADTAVIRARGRDDFEVVNMHWEFIPWWIKNTAELKQARSQGKARQQGQPGAVVAAGRALGHTRLRVDGPVRQPA